MRYATLFVLALTCLHLAACNDAPASEAIGKGEMTDRTYNHEHFGLSITFPEEWDIMERSQFEKVMNVGTDALTDSGVDKRAAEASKNNTIAMFMVTKGGFSFENGTDCGFNAMTERVKGSGIETGKAYNDTIMKMYKDIGMRVTSGSSRDQTISGVEFSVQPMTFRAPRGKVMVELYSARIGDYMLVFSSTAGSDQEQADVNELIKEIKIEG
ncbi:MAG: hypothetical protein AAGB26_02850 [Planctomycetota bacterium]